MQVVSRNYLINNLYTLPLNLKPLLLWRKLHRGIALKAMQVYITTIQVVQKEITLKQETGDLGLVGNHYAHIAQNLVRQNVIVCKNSSLLG